MPNGPNFVHLPRRLFLQLLAGAGATSLGGCALMGMDEFGNEAASSATAEDRKLMAFFKQSFDRDLERSPEFMTQMGIKRRYGEWDDRSDAFAEETHRLAVADLEALNGFDRNSLSDPMRVSHDVYKFACEQEGERFDFRYHDYRISHFDGPHQTVPATLMNLHGVESAEDAEAYLSRLRGTAQVFDQSIAFLQKQESLGITLPRFSYGLLVADAKAAIKGAPFDGDGENAIAVDFTAKVDKLTLDPAAKEKLKADAKAALINSLGPAFQRFIGAATDIGSRVKDDHGVGTLPDGAAYYEASLHYHTTLGLKADEIHAIGLEEVKRLSDEMTGLKTKLGFKGSLKSFYADLRKNSRYFFSNTDEGREAYMQEAADLLARASAALPTVFGVLPKTKIDVKRIEPYREKGLTIAFYDRGAPDGSRPGHVYLNLSDMTKMPNWQMAALIFHEGIPGHHLQISIAQESQGIPEFRKHASFTAFIEGWGLYTELLAKEMGLYRDVLDDVGRVAMAQWRACRLVVDTGIHAQHWTREQAIEYLMQNTPTSRGGAVKAIERYIVMPGQATAYTIGRLKIMELRDQARTKLGDDFDLREFHDVVLRSGPVTLNVLEDQVARYIRNDK